MAVGNIESRLIDEFTPAAASPSDLQIRTRTGGQPTEPPVSIEVTLVIGSETSAGWARLMMHKFSVPPASLIDNVVRRAIGIALQPQHFIGDVLGMNRCHGRLVAPLCRPSRQGAQSQPIEAFRTKLSHLPWATSSCRYLAAKSANFGPFLYLALLLTMISYLEVVGEVLQYARDAR
ncbi:hypothetical protein THAOC_20732 [Thalassiosira oceanica]|uniref:DUF6820 domain-containing protein n=1 Tax=Thalassiosira oceanica TaxID=159749 RepID=K0S1D5_THAOC|nr:hypothetical protein THAOC_20732 [Thalassiosira oceanica]|eukprot:EJK59085.1 hypothetical protein THAOC_20732 [Thalassiosira oceanica]